MLRISTYIKHPELFFACLPNFFRSLSNFCTNLCHLKTNHIFINYIYILVIDSVPPVLFCFSRVVLICMHEKMFVFVCLLFLSTKKNNSYSPLKTAFYLTRPVFFLSELLSYSIHFERVLHFQA